MTAARTYRRLTRPGYGDPFDRHLLACTLALAAAEPPPVAEGLGLSRPALAAMVRLYFPHAADLATGDGEAALSPEEPDLRRLLLAHRSGRAPEEEWLAHIVARRALAPNHLWQDLGLNGRTDLSILIRRHFAPLAAKNDRDMKWKKFLYRQLCLDEDILICKSPVCDACADFALCFGAEDGACRLSDTVSHG